ncbi:MAG: TlpA family protein disulfide reductase, partial [Armatimonadetes bacterium]|nr:TlpA family protein disulfide reductase [Armatimonadota bacterium]
QLPVWQRFYEKHKDRGFELVSVAMDAQGAGRVRPFVQAAGVTYPVLLDEENLLGRIFGFRVIPNGFLVDEQGVLRFKHIGGYDVRKPGVAEHLEALLVGSTAQAPAQAAAADAPRIAAQIFALFQEGVALYRQGKAAEAAARWREAERLDPANFVVRKQLWAVENPDRFYPEIDLDWQKKILGKA